MKLQEAYKLLNKLYPFKVQCDWDNSGVFYNANKNNEITSITACLDFDEKVLQQAIKNKSNLVIAHHPLFDNDFNKPLLKKIKKAKVSYIAMHTNFDKSPIGMNYHLSNKLGLKGAKLLKDTMAFTGKMARSYSQKEFAILTKKIFDFKSVQLYSCNDKKIQKIAIVGGGGMDYIANIKDLKIDLFLTGDVRWHGYRQAHVYGINVLDIGHISEKIIIDVIEEKFTSLNIKVHRVEPIDYKVNL